MKRHHKAPNRIVIDPAYRQSIQRLEEALARDQSNRLYQERVEELKLTQVRMALFGCAPK